MATKQDIISSELIREIVAIRTDTVWKMLALKQQGQMPRVAEEGATGAHDNKGALFIPGGLVFEDSDKNEVVRTRHGALSPRVFRKKVRQAMRFDNATLLFADGIAVGVNLDNGFFSEMSGHILAGRQAAFKRSRVQSNEPPPRITTDQITRSFTPAYFPRPYGARTRLSSCLAACLIEPRMYFIQCRNHFGMRDREAAEFWTALTTAGSPVTGTDGTVLAPPYIVVCHTTRYKAEILGGTVRVLGTGPFGEFATITMERMGRELRQELQGKIPNHDPSAFVAHFHDIRVAAILRIYPRTTPGRRLMRVRTHLIHPQADLKLNLEKITERARERYKI